MWLRLMGAVVIFYLGGVLLNKEKSNGFPKMYYFIAYWDVPVADKDNVSSFSISFAHCIVGHY